MTSSAGHVAGQVEQAGFRLDLGRCTGCSACVVACRNENDVGEDLAWRSVFTFNEPRHAGIDVFHFSMACNHCREPACLHGCPALAYLKDPDTGAVLLDPDRCIGCRYCTWVCPYGAPQYNAETRVVEKCTFCSHRLVETLDPACVTACPVDALGYDPPGQAAGPRDRGSRTPGFPDVGLGPAIRILPPRRGGAPLEIIGGEEDSIPPGPPPGSAPGSHLAGEWPLLVFTTILTWLVAWLAAAAAQGVAPNPWQILAPGALAMGVSGFHLGRPEKAWRAVLNLRSSWVSREIVFLLAFLGAAAAQAVFGELGWLVAGLGFATLLCVDMVYRVPGQRVPAVPHSAATVPTAAFLLGLLLHEPVLAVAAGLLKASLYLVRWSRHGVGSTSLALVRLGVGFIAPLAVWRLAPAAPGWFLLAGPAAGELLDRARFYEELDFLSPATRIQADLDRLLTSGPGRTSSVWSG